MTTIYGPGHNLSAAAVRAATAALPSRATRVMQPAQPVGSWNAFPGNWGGKLSAQGHTVVSGTYPQAFFNDPALLAQEAADALSR